MFTVKCITYRTIRDAIKAVFSRTETPLPRSDTPKLVSSWTRYLQMGKITESPKVAYIGLLNVANQPQ